MFEMIVVGGELGENSRLLLLLRSSKTHGEQRTRREAIIIAEMQQLYVRPQDIITDIDLLANYMSQLVYKELEFSYYFFPGI